MSKSKGAFFDIFGGNSANGRRSLGAMNTGEAATDGSGSSKTCELNYYRDGEDNTSKASTGWGTTGIV